MMSEPKLITTWDELKECTSETHTLEIDFDECSGWIIDKKDSNNYYYLSTHAFYGCDYEYYTKLLQKYGFNVQLANWDANWNEQ